MLLQSMPSVERVICDELFQLTFSFLYTNMFACVHAFLIICFTEMYAAVGSIVRGLIACLQPNRTSKLITEKILFAD